MTKKDYEQIAQVFNTYMELAQNDPSAEIDQDTVEYLVNDMAHMLHRDNARFDRSKFLVACGVK